LQKFVAEMASTPLNPVRPRWEFNLVDTANGNSALVVRIHHAIADGIALIGVINSLTDERVDAREDGEPGAETGAGAPAEGDPDDHQGDAGDIFWRLVIEPLSDVALTSIRVGGHLWGHYLGLRQDPGTLRDYARFAGAIAQEVGKLALLPNDSTTRFKGKAGTVKRVAWSKPISLTDIKAVGKVLGCSVNDTLLSSVAALYVATSRRKAILCVRPRFASWFRSICGRPATAGHSATTLASSLSNYRSASKIHSPGSTRHAPGWQP
jgi:diacylglycerol O-acyltransferase